MMVAVLWIHEWVAQSGVMDKLLAGDTNVCAIVGVLAGCVIAGRNHGLWQND